MPCKIIAEIGCNWQNLEQAIDMIKKAKKAGAAYVKFQVFNEGTIEDAPCGFRDRLKKLILDEEQIKRLADVARIWNVGFILTPMYEEAVAIATKYADYIKIRFKDHENKTLIDKALDTGKTLLISVPYLPPIAQQMFHPRIKYMYCLPTYPPRVEDFCLEFAVTCHGFSSHFPHTICDLAYAINTSYEESFIEKHVMFPRSKFKFSEGHNYHPIDEAVSITFPQLRNLVKQLRMISRIRRVRL